MDFLPDDAVLHRYKCSLCSKMTESFFCPPPCVCNSNAVWSNLDMANSAHTYDSGYIVQYDSVYTIDEFVEEEVDRDDLDRSTREMEKLRRGIGVENADQSRSDGSVEQT